MPRKKKQPNNSISVNNGKKLPIWLNDLNSLLSWKQSGLTENDAELFAQSMLDWSVTDEAWDFLGFYNLIGVHSSTYDDWREKYPKLQEVYTFVKQRLAERRQRKATFKEHNANPGVVMFTMRKYHRDWQDCYEEDQAHKKDQATNVLEKYFEKYELQLPELNEQDKDSVSSRDSKGSD